MEMENMYIFVKLLLLSFMTLQVRSLSTPINGTAVSVNSTSSIDLDPLIVGGVEARRNEFPWLVHLSIRTNAGTFLCGGALIKMNEVLTAAHCVYGALASNIIVTAGDHDRRVLEGTEQRSQARVVRVHEDYMDIAGNPHDIAVLELVQPFNRTYAVWTIGLPAPDALINSTSSSRGTVAGWGTLSYGGSLPGVLRKVEVPIVTNIYCTRQLRQASTQFCAGTTGMDSCQGDSGGPFLCQDLPGQVCGIVSYGNECARPNYPGVYTKVSAYVHWINKVQLPTTTGRTATPTTTPSSANVSHCSGYILFFIFASMKLF